MTINYDVFLWWFTATIIAFLILFLGKKIFLRFKVNEYGNVSKHDKKQISRDYKTANYIMVLFSGLALVLLAVFFGFNTNISHETVLPAKIPEIKAPAITEINEAHEQEIVDKREKKIEASKQQAKHEYDQFLKESLNKEE